MLKYMKLHPDAKKPSRKHSDDIGLDIYSIEDRIIESWEGILVRTGIAIEFDSFKGVLFWDKSSSSWDFKNNKGLFIKVCGGAIDPQYRGELFVALFNMGKNEFVIKKGQAICQMIKLTVDLDEVVEVFEMSKTDRGNTGYGGVEVK